MDTQLLKYIYDAATYGSITRAAQFNFISPSHLSRQLKKIEEMFSITIFERNNNGVTLTKQGQEFIQYVETVLKDIQILEKRYNYHLPTQDFFSFRIAVHHNSMGNQAAANLINQYIDRYEFVDVVVDSYHSLHETVNAVNRHHYMLGIIQFNSANRMKVNALLSTENLKKIDVDISKPYVLISDTHPLANQHTISEEDLKAYPRLLYVDEAINNQQDIAGFNINFQAVKKRVLIKERAQLFQFLHSMNAYYIGTKLIQNCSVCDGSVMIPFDTPVDYTIYTSVIYSPSSPNHTLIDQYISQLRAVAQDTIPPSTA